MDLSYESLIKPLLSKIEAWIESFVTLLPNFVVAIIVIFVFWIIARVVRNLFKKLLDKTQVQPTISRLMGTVAYVVVICVGAFVALGVLKLDKTVTSLLAGAGVLGLALSFAFQDIAANFISGVMIAVRKPFRVGDVIETNSKFGTISQINLRTTILDSTQGQTVIIPNKEVFQDVMVNFSTGQRRIDLEVGVSYDDDLSKVMKVTREAIEEIQSDYRKDDLKVFFTGFGASSIDLVIQYWIQFNKQPDYLKAKSDGIMKIKQAFDANDISIPFPIRTLDIPENFTEALSLRSKESDGKESISENKPNPE